MKPTALLAILLTGCATHHPRLAITVPVSPVTSCPSDSTLCIKADQLPPDATHAMFGPLRREYGSAIVRVCSNLGAATTVPLAYVESQYTERSGITVMPTLAALAVIAHAQASTKTAIALNGIITAAQLAAAATQLSNVSAAVKAALTDTALGGASLYTILKGATTSGSMLQYSSITLPESLDFQPRGCVSGVVLDHGVGGAPAAGSISFGVMLPGK